MQHDTQSVENKKSIWTWGFENQHDIADTDSRQTPVMATQ